MISLSRDDDHNDFDHRSCKSEKKNIDSLLCDYVLIYRFSSVIKFEDESIDYSGLIFSV